MPTAVQIVWYVAQTLSFGAQTETFKGLSDQASEICTLWFKIKRTTKTSHLSKYCTTSNVDCWRKIALMCVGGSSH